MPPISSTDQVAALEDVVEVASLRVRRPRSRAAADLLDRSARSSAGERAADGPVAEQADPKPIRRRRWNRRPALGGSDIAGRQVVVGLAAHDHAGVPSLQKITGGRGTAL